MNSCIKNNYGRVVFFLERVRIMSTLKRFIKDERGLETVEYAIITALIVAGTITVLGTIGRRVLNTFTTVDAGLVGAGMT